MKIDDFVHEYYSVARFRAAYAGRVEAMTDRSQWPEVDLGFKVYPPLLGRAPGRPKVQRRRGGLEKNANKRKCNAVGARVLDTWPRPLCLAWWEKMGRRRPVTKGNLLLPTFMVYVFYFN